MKLLIVNTGGLGYEGITCTLLDFLKTMNKEDMQIDLVATEECEEDILNLFENIGCRIIPMVSRRKKTTKYFLDLFNLIRYEKYDIIHAHGNSATLAIEMLAAKLAGCNVRIAHSRNTKCEYVKADKLLRPIFNLTYTHAFACGEEAGKWLFRDRNFEIIYNGKDFSNLKFSQLIRETTREKYNMDDRLIIGHVGNFNYQKNHEFVLDIFEEVLKANPDSQLYLIGDGPLRAGIEEKVNEKKITDKVIFMGRIGNVPKMLQAMDIMIFPSRFEGLPNVVLEWQISGLPCVISDEITQECVITDLVQFQSLNNPPKDWADQVNSLRISNREKDSQFNILKMKEAGFDLEENAKMLREKYFHLASYYSNT